MNKFLLIALTLIGLSAFGQNGSVDGTAYHTRLTDSTKIVTPTGYGTLAYFSQDNGGTWKIWQSGVKYDLQKFALGLPGAGVFASNVTFTLPAGHYLGKYGNGDTAPWAGLTAVQALMDAAVAYINPVYNSFSVSQSSPVEVGTTISGSKTFTWSINANSGVVSTIDLYDVTGSSTLLAGTPNDGSQTQTVATRQLNSSGATQVWRGVGNNSSPSGTFNSSDYTVISYFLYFYGPNSASVASSADVRGLSSSAFRSSGTTFNLNTGTSLTKFIVALPPSITISQVIDLDALNANITSQYISQGTLSVLDAGGTSRTYNIYEMNVGVAYASNHRHAITIN